MKGKFIRSRVTIRKHGKEWTPVRKGRTFCSPRCGRPCTIEMFDTAMARCLLLVNKLGDGWKGELWENLGWHYKAISPCGRWHIHTHHYPSAKVSYSAFLGAPNRDSGGKWAESGKSPRLAMLAVVARVEEDLGEISNFVDVRVSIPRAKEPKRPASRAKYSSLSPAEKQRRNGTWKGHRS